MSKFKALKHTQSNNNPSTLRAIGMAEIVLGASQMFIALRGDHAMSGVGVGVTFISLGVIFLCQARQMQQSN